MSARAAVLAAALACMLPAASHAGCDLARFGAAATGNCQRSGADCMPAFLPAEMRAIGKGAALETVGLAANDGRATWRALDIDHGEVIVVERYAGRRVGEAPKPGRDSASDYVKTIDPEPARSIDHVRRYPVSPTRAAALACLVSDVGAGRAPAVRKMADTGGRLYLMLGNDAHVETAVGSFAGGPARFAQAIDDIVKRRRPGAADTPAR